MTTFLYISSGRPEWMVDVPCTQTDPELFFPEKGGSTYEAQLICTGCPSRLQCLTWAIDHNETYGVWGGMTYNGRKEYVRTKIDTVTDWHGTRMGYRRHMNKGEKPCGPCRNTYNRMMRDRHNGRET